MSVGGLKLLVYEALSYIYIRARCSDLKGLQMSVGGLKLLVYEALSYIYIYGRDAQT